MITVEVKKIKEYLEVSGFEELKKKIEGLEETETVTFGYDCDERKSKWYALLRGWSAEYERKKSARIMRRFKVESLILILNAEKEINDRYLSNLRSLRRLNAISRTEYFVLAKSDKRVLAKFTYDETSFDKKYPNVILNPSYEQIIHGLDKEEVECMKRESNEKDDEKEIEGE